MIQWHQNDTKRFRITHRSESPDETDDTYGRNLRVL